MGAAQNRRYDAVRDEDIPDSRAALGGKAGDQGRQCADVGYRFARETEAARDGRQIGAPEDRSGIGQAISAELMDLGPVRRRSWPR